ncbi:hypothetical protein Y1Q_0014272 [Alligator mississippiensis]|uniref:Uncharacterized protein n=1 Tax=Alligator mississippiensis TaxID=8496 RepID=A0A151LZK6_ALLMI|nr:hypothetical protein Y1Q_0014272 [Alligator mississippiensis]
MENLPILDCYSCCIGWFCLPLPPVPNRSHIGGNVAFNSSMQLFIMNISLNKMGFVDQPAFRSASLLTMPA